MRETYKKLVSAIDGAKKAYACIAQNRGLEKEQAREAFEQYVSDEFAETMRDALADAEGDLDAKDLLKLAETLRRMLEDKGLLTDPTLTPPDRERCQVESRSFMTLGPGMTRCGNKPMYIVTEKVSEDGRLGSMSMCETCLEVFKKKMGPAGMKKYEITDIVVLKKAPKNPTIAGHTRTGVLLRIGEAQRLHDEANSMTEKELRSFGKKYFSAEWLAKAKKKTIAQGFRKHLEAFLARYGEKPL